LKLRVNVRLIKKRVDSGDFASSEFQKQCAIRSDPAFPVQESFPRNI
jgi:hypothetical protein